MKMVYVIRLESKNRMLNFFVTRRYIFSYIKRTVWELPSEVTRKWWSKIIQSCQCLQEYMEVTVGERLTEFRSFAVGTSFCPVSN